MYRMLRAISYVSLDMEANNSDVRRAEFIPSLDRRLVLVGSLDAEIGTSISPTIELETSTVVPSELVFSEIYEQPYGDTVKQLTFSGEQGQQLVWLDISNNFRYRGHVHIAAPDGSDISDAFIADSDEPRVVELTQDGQYTVTVSRIDDYPDSLPLQYALVDLAGLDASPKGMTFGDRFQLIAVDGRIG